MVYKWGTISYKVPAQAAGEEVERIASIKPLTPEALVEESKDQQAPLHPIFEWDNEKASHEWRKQQARVMLGNLVTVQIESVELKEPTRAFINVAKQESSYTVVDVVLKDEKLFAQVRIQALAELEGYQRKYQAFLDLKKHFVWLEKYKEQIKKERAGAHEVSLGI